MELLLLLLLLEVSQLASLWLPHVVDAGSADSVFCVSLSHSFCDAFVLLPLQWAGQRAAVPAP